MKTWLITGVSSGFGKAMTKQLLKRGNRVVGTVRNRKKKQKNLAVSTDAAID